MSAPTARDIEDAALDRAAIRLASWRRSGGLHGIGAWRDGDFGFVRVDAELPGARRVRGVTSPRQRLDRPLRRRERRQSRREGGGGEERDDCAGELHLSVSCFRNRLIEESICRTKELWWW